MAVIRDIDESQAPLLDHLIELRSRLVKCVLALVVAFGVCLYFADPILGFLIQPLKNAFPEGEGQLIFTKLYEVFFVELKVALFAGFCLSFPVIANQLWAFVAPGLYAREKKAFLPFILATPILFLMGASLAYFVVMPTAFRWFLGFQGTAGISRSGDAVHSRFRNELPPACLAFAITSGRDRDPRPACGGKTVCGCARGCGCGHHHAARSRLAIAARNSASALVRRLACADASDRETPESSRRKARRASVRVVDLPSTHPGFDHLGGPQLSRTGDQGIAIDENEIGAFAG